MPESSPGTLMGNTMFVKVLILLAPRISEGLDDVVVDALKRGIETQYHIRKILIRQYEYRGLVRIKPRFRAVYADGVERREQRPPVWIRFIIA